MCAERKALVVVKRFIIQKMLLGQKRSLLMKICLLVLVGLLFCQLGCAGDLIQTDEIVSIEISKFAQNKNIEKSKVITDRTQISLIVNVVNKCRREPMIIPVHFKVEIKFKKRQLTIFSIQNIIKIDGITYKLDDNLEAMLGKMIE